MLQYRKDGVKLYTVTVGMGNADSGNTTVAEFKFQSAVFIAIFF